MRRYLTYDKYNEYYNGSAHIHETSHNPTDSAYLSFTNTGLMINHYYDTEYNSQTNEETAVERYDTSYYTINGNQLRTISKDVADTNFMTIQTLTSSTLSLYDKNHMSSDASQYNEEWYTLKKQ